MRDSSSNWCPGRICQVVGVSVPLLAMLFLAGCGGTSTKPGLTQAAAATSASMLPPEVTANKVLLDVTLLAELPRSNPFTSMLTPKVDPNAVTADNTEVVAEPTPIPPPPDPFEGFTLNGILYRAKRSMAIIMMPDGKTKIVHVGDSFPAATAEVPLRVKVARIDKLSITLQLVNPPPEYTPDLRTRTYDVPSLIGYGAKESSSSSSQSYAAASRQKTTASSSASSGSGDKASSSSSTPFTPFGNSELDKKTLKELEDLAK